VWEIVSSSSSRIKPKTIKLVFAASLSYFYRDDDDVCFVQDQCALSKFHTTTSSLKQQSAGRHVTFNSWLIDWCLTPTSAVFQLYRSLVLWQAGIFENFYYRLYIYQTGTLRGKLHLFIAFLMDAFTDIFFKDYRVLLIRYTV
jgi:hypothetical protein